MSRVLIFIISNALLLNLIVYMEVEIFNVSFFNILIYITNMHTFNNIPYICCR
jgi:hypothetical protein